MPKLFKKLSLILLSSILFLNSMVMPFAVAKAADEAPSTWYTQNPIEWYLKVYDEESSPASEIFGERYTAAQVQWIFYSLFSMIINIVPGNPKTATCIMGKHATADCVKSVLETLDALTPLTDSSSQNIAEENPILNTISKNPISGIGYTKDLINKFNPVKEVHAQGFGFNTGSTAIKTLWQATRNISYGLIVLAVIVMAFMIMFRVKMSPQIVISVQSAIPNIIFTTVLITFSYAIAGFAIDLMYVVIGIMSSLLTSSGFSNDTFTKLFTEFTTGHGLLTIMLQYWVAFVYTTFLTIFTSELDFVLTIIMFIFAILSILAIIIWCFKIIFVVFKNFAMLMLTIATGPLEILVGAFTGKSTFGAWFRKLLSILIVYPLLGLIFFFSFFFLWQGSTDGNDWFTDDYANSMAFNVRQNMITDNEWQPPFTKLGGPGEHGVNASDGLVWLMVSFFIFSQATKVTEIVQGLISGKGYAYGTAIGEAVGAAKTGSMGYGAYVANELKTGTPWPLGYIKNQKFQDFLNNNNSNISATLETLLKSIR